MGSYNLLIDFLKKVNLSVKTLVSSPALLAYV